MTRGWRSRDLVIAVDDSNAPPFANAPSAGALGIETWLLLPVQPNRRWAEGLERAMWYLSVQPIRRPPETRWGVESRGGQRAAGGIDAEPYRRLSEPSDPARLPPPLGSHLRSHSSSDRRRDAGTGRSGDRGKGSLFAVTVVAYADGLSGRFPPLPEEIAWPARTCLLPDREWDQPGHA